ncbi:DNA distortion polypeptide 3 [Salmonella enterica]|nr:DNA distortion polypeptide 3 [Salmonella enterica]
MTYSRFLLERFMKFDVKEFIDDKYAKAINILKENLKENYHIFYGIRLSEILFPASEYGTDAFYQEFEAINSVVLPLVIYDLNEKKPIIVIGFELKNGKTMLESSDVTVLEIESLSDILTNDVLSVLFVE